MTDAICLFLIYFEWYNLKQTCSSVLFSWILQLFSCFAFTTSRSLNASQISYQNKKKNDHIREGCPYCIYLEYPINIVEASAQMGV